MLSRGTVFTERKPHFRMFAERKLRTAPLRLRSPAAKTISASPLDFEDDSDQAVRQLVPYRNRDGPVLIHLRASLCCSRQPRAANVRGELADTTRRAPPTDHCAARPA